MDSVGAGQRLWTYGASGRVRERPVEAAAGSGLARLRSPMPLGMLADPILLLRSGYDAVTITMLSKNLSRLHTDRDSSANLSIESFRALSCLVDRHLHTQLT